MMKLERFSPHGWLIIDKPLHITSARAVALVKRKLGQIKIGHAGTLDPLATGVLPLALGEATKTVSYVMTEKKRYRFEVTWGEERTTDDTEGQVRVISVQRPSKKEILAVLSDFQGEILQAPPLYSALKIKGERACDLMRRHENVSLMARPVHICSLELKEIVSSDRAIFDVECGKGTYVRAIARDMGKKLGCYAYASAIDRLSVGRFEKNQALSLEKLASLDENVILRKYVRKIPDVLDDIPAVRVSEMQATRLRQGQGIISEPLDGLGKEHQGHLFLSLDPSQKPVAFVRYHENELWPERVFNI